MAAQESPTSTAIAAWNTIWLIEQGVILGALSPKDGKQLLNSLDLSPTRDLDNAFSPNPGLGPLRR